MNRLAARRRSPGNRLATDGPAVPGRHEQSTICKSMSLLSWIIWRSRDVARAASIRSRPQCASSPSSGASKPTRRMRDCRNRLEHLPQSFSSIAAELAPFLRFVAGRCTGNSVLDYLQQTHLDNLSSRLSLYHHWLFCKRINALMRPCRGLFLGDKFGISRKRGGSCVFEFRVPNVL
jgi:hypothetical protein